MRRASYILTLSAVVAAAAYASPALAVPDTVGTGGWTYFSDPRALRHAGEDYIGWLGPVGEILVNPFGYAWLALLALTLTRLTCLPRRTSDPAERVLYFVLPFILIVAIGIAVRYDADAGASESALRGYALEAAGLGQLPEVERDDLQVLLASRHDLSHADLRTQDLHDLSVRAKNLADAQLTLANLDHADLAGASLRRADLRGVMAAGARLRGADLRGANLRCANLEGADLRDARLAGVRWRGAITDDTTRWPDGFRPRRHGMTDREEQVATTWYSSDYSFNGYLAYDCSLGTGT